MTDHWATRDSRCLVYSTANAAQGLTWGGQTYETKDGKVAGVLSTLSMPVSQGVDIHDTEAVLLAFS